MARILVVDDEKDMRDMLCNLLSVSRHEIAEAENGSQALDLMSNETYDLVLTDVVMPDIDGIELIMKIRERVPAQKIIAMSGGGGIEGRYDYLEITRLVGANQIMQKPFTMQQLKDSVQKALA